MLAASRPVDVVLGTWEGLVWQGQPKFQQLGGEAVCTNQDWSDLDCFSLPEDLVNSS